MHETKIEMKLEEEMKPLKKICETLEEAVKHEFEKGIEYVNVEEMGEVIDMVKDVYEAKEKLIKGCYYKQILTAMEKAEEEEKQDEKSFIKMMKEEYGMEDEEEARRFYRGQPRSRTTGRFMSRGDGRRSNSGRRSRRGYEEMPYMYMYPEMYGGMTPEEMRDMDLDMNRMYYSGGSTSSGGSSGSYGGGSSSGGSVSGGSGSSGMSGGSSGGGSSRGYSEGYSEGQSRGYSEGYSDGERSGRSSQRRDYREGRSGQSRKRYFESKEENKGNSAEEKQKKLKDLEGYMKDLAEDLSEIISDASNEEKTMVKAKVQTLLQHI